MGVSSPDTSVSLSIMPEKIQGRSQQDSKAHTWHAYERTIKMLSIGHLSLSFIVLNADIFLVLMKLPFLVYFTISTL